MDAILAVVIGGSSLAGGKYSLSGTLVGALIIQTLTTTVYSMGIAPEVTLVFKAVVVIAVCLLQAPKVRERFTRRRRRPVTAETSRPTQSSASPATLGTEPVADDTTTPKQKVAQS